MAFTRSFQKTAKQGDYLRHDASDAGSAGKKMMGGSALIGAGGVAAAMKKKPRLAIALGGVSAMGMMGGSHVHSYKSSLNRLADAVDAKKPLTSRDLEMLHMSNPSGSLMARVKPRHLKKIRKELRRE